MAQLPYLPHTQADIQAMLDKIGVKKLDELYSDVPAEFLHKGAYALPPAMSEQEIRDCFASLEAMNAKLKVFVGAGAYDHYTPAVIPYLCSRSEFLTAYTPYQCEISQGTLRYIFEYQSLICALTGLDVSNASLYDGPTAAAEAMKMAVACTRKKTRVLLSKGLLPHVIEVVETYARFHGVEMGYVPVADGQTSLEGLKAELAKDDVAGVIVPSINRYGIVEDHSGFADAIHAEKGLLIEYCDPSALAVVKTPAEWDADIAIGDGQPLGLPLCYGGPYVGFMAVKKDHMRKMPGRIVGQTVDKEGRRVFVLTLQAREQHIKREKATSNICSNESLMALWVTIYLSLMGPEGLREVNRLSSDGAHYLYNELLKTGRFEEVFPGKPFLKEFVLKPKQNGLQERLEKAGFFAALPTEEGYVSFCVTEKRTKAEIDALVKAVKEG
ncbi:MAG: aminomethyl-transferring glycine dehydrogenase subunit GcvPA [Candidatus Cryptobacteroides sp.]|nr:aminomethyl-transferring glycine dehydrogenase subunit GcvPA [Candidatus Cryptobacteroides sp.]